MAKVSLPAPPRSSDPDKLCEWARELTEELGFLLTHLDGANMTAKAAEQYDMKGNTE